MSTRACDVPHNPQHHNPGLSWDFAAIAGLRPSRCCGSHGLSVLCVCGWFRLACFPLVVHEACWSARQFEENVPEAGSWWVAVSLGHPIWPISFHSLLCVHVPTPVCLHAPILALFITIGAGRRDLR